LHLNVCIGFYLIFVMSAASPNTPNQDSSLQGQLAQASPPTYKTLREDFSHVEIWDTLRKQPAAKRILRAQRWCTQAGLPSATAKDADRALKRLAHEPKQQAPQVVSPASVLLSPRAQFQRRPKRARAGARLFPQAVAKPLPSWRLTPSKHPGGFEADIKKLQQHAQASLLAG
jgi:hypothetical protein